MIGTGNFSLTHACILKKIGVIISGCYGTNTEKTLYFSQLFNCDIYDNPLKLISKKYVDAIYIVIPPFAHDGLIEKTAINNKIPFLCEKPLGLEISICNFIAN